MKIDSLTKNALSDGLSGKLNKEKEWTNFIEDEGGSRRIERRSDSGQQSMDRKSVSDELGDNERVSELW